MHLKEIQSVEGSDSKHYFPHLSEGPVYLGVALAGEVGEVCNEIKKWARDDFPVAELRERLRKELPDVLIYLVMLADHLNLDLEADYKEKKEYNDRRYLKQ